MQGYVAEPRPTVLQRQRVLQVALGLRARLLRTVQLEPVFRVSQDDQPGFSPVSPLGGQQEAQRPPQQVVRQGKRRPEFYVGGGWQERDLARFGDGPVVGRLAFEKKAARRDAVTDAGRVKR